MIHSFKLLLSLPHLSCRMFFSSMAVNISDLLMCVEVDLTLYPAQHQQSKQWNNSVVEVKVNFTMTNKTVIALETWTCSPQTRLDRLNQVDWALVSWLLLSLPPGLGRPMAGWPGLYLSVPALLSPPQARQELNPSHVSAYLRIKKRTTRSRQYLYFRRFLQGICRADNQNHIITYIKEAKDSPKEFGALREGDVLGEE